MAQAFCTGASLLYAGIGPNRSPLFLGTTETIPGLDNKQSWDAVMNDVSGSIEPLDFIFEGGGLAFISLVLTRWNQTPLNLLDVLPGLGPFAGGTVLGSYALKDIGSLAAQEGNAFPMWVVYAFGSAPGMANKAAAYPGMEPGIYFPQCLLWGPSRTETGTRAKKEHRIFQAWKKYLPGSQTFMLYSKDPSFFVGLPAPD